MTDYWNHPDYDLAACLEFNPQNGFTIDDVVKKLAVIEGANEADAWHWILELKDGRFVYLTGGCDYTGWDCQSSATSSIWPTCREALTAVDSRRKSGILEAQCHFVSTITTEDKFEADLGPIVHHMVVHDSK